MLKTLPMYGFPIADLITGATLKFFVLILTAVN